MGPGRFLWRQLAWGQAAFGLYSKNEDQVDDLRLMGWVGFRDIHYPEKHIRSVLKEFTIKRSSLRPFHQNHYKQTFQIPSDPIRGHSIFLKLYQFDCSLVFNPRHWVRSLKPQKCFRLSYRLQSLNVPTAKAIFYLRRRQNFGSEYLLATETLPSTEVLDRWIRTGISSMDADCHLEFMTKLGSYVGQVHLNGIYHRTLEYSTVVCTDPFRFYVIDLDHVMTVGAMFRYEQTRQLRQFEELLLTQGASSKDIDAFHVGYRKAIIES